MKKLLKALLLTSALAATHEASAAEGKTAILAGGCFWCLQHDLDSVKGVTATSVGYAGGDRTSPTYENYHDLDATHKIPHIEVVQVTYDPAVLSYEQLLQIFVRRIDVTDNGGQFCDRGPAYRPAIFAADATEQKTATQVLQQTAATLAQPVKVELLPNAIFWPAEEYHQHYADKNPTRYNFYRWKCGRDARIEKLWQGR